MMTVKSEVIPDGFRHAIQSPHSSAAMLAQAWSYERLDSKGRFFAVLHVPPIKEPVECIRQLP